MDESLIDDGSLSIDRKSRLPGAGFFYPDTLDRERDAERTAAAVEGSEAVVVTDSDADGLACLALVRAAYDASVDPAPFLSEFEDVSSDEASNADGDTANADTANADESLLPAPVADNPVGLVASGPRGFAEDLARVAETLEPGADVFLCDICPDSFESIESQLRTVVHRADSVRWFDHHQWDDDVAAAVREAGVDLVVGESEAECSADVTLRSLDGEFPEAFTELVAVTRDHDLWLKEDPRSDDLADLSFWTDAETYAAIVGGYGVDFPEPVQAFLTERREEKDALIDAAVSRAEEHEVGEWSVGVTYGRCSQNEVAERLRKQGMDAAVIVKPAGSASIRGSEDGFERAHEVAGLVNGGGHPQAAGCKPDIYDDMLDYARHWTTEGEAAKRVILAAFERIAERAAEEDSQPVE